MFSPVHSSFPKVIIQITKHTTPGKQSGSQALSHDQLHHTTSTADIKIYTVYTHTLNTTAGICKPKYFLKKNNDCEQQIECFREGKYYNNLLA